MFFRTARIKRNKNKTLRQHCWRLDPSPICHGAPSILGKQHCLVVWWGRIIPYMTWKIKFMFQTTKPEQHVGWVFHNPRTVDFPSQGRKHGLSWWLINGWISKVLAWHIQQSATIRDHQPEKEGQMGELTEFHLIVLLILEWSRCIHLFQYSIQPYGTEQKRSTPKQFQTPNMSRVFESFGNYETKIISVVFFPWKMIKPGNQEIHRHRQRLVGFQVGRWKRPRSWADAAMFRIAPNRWKHMETN